MTAAGALVRVHAAGAIDAHSARGAVVGAREGESDWRSLSWQRPVSGWRGDEPLGWRSLAPRDRATASSPRRARGAVRGARLSAPAAGGARGRVANAVATFSRGCARLRGRAFGPQLRCRRRDEHTIAAFGGHIVAAAGRAGCANRSVTASGRSDGAAPCVWCRVHARGACSAGPHHVGERAVAGVLLLVVMLRVGGYMRVARETPEVQTNGQ